MKSLQQYPNCTATVASTAPTTKRCRDSNGMDQCVCLRKIEYASSHWKFYAMRNGKTCTKLRQTENLLLCSGGSGDIRGSGGGGGAGGGDVFERTYRSMQPSYEQHSTEMSHMETSDGEMVVVDNDDTTTVNVIQTNRCMHLTLRICFSTPGLCVLVILYSLMGACLFPFFEAPLELHNTLTVIKSREECLRELWTITGTYQIFIQLLVPHLLGFLCVNFLFELLQFSLLHRKLRRIS